MVVTAPTVVGTPQALGFTTSGTVMTYTGGGSGSNLCDLVCINSDNVVTTPSGWSLATSRVNFQGSYIFYRLGSTTTVTLDLGGGIASNSSALWLRLKDVTALDSGATATAGVDAGAAGVNNTPAVTTGSLSTATEAVIAFAALHNFTTAPASGSWSTGFTSAIGGAQGSGGTGSAGDVGVKTPAGTAAESPTFSWTNNALDRYILVVALTGADPGGSTIAPTGIAAPAALGSPTLANAMDAITPTGIAVARGFGSPTVANSMDAITPTGIAVARALGSPTLAQSFTVTPAGITATVALGTPTVSMNVGGAIAPTGIAIAAALGAPTAAQSLTITPSGVAITSALGTPTVRMSIAPVGIPAPSALGSPTVTSDAPPPEPTVTIGSWYGLLGILQAGRTEYAEDIAREPVACPNDGEPLRVSVTGVKYCPYDGWRPGMPTA